MTDREIILHGLRDRDDEGRAALARIVEERWLFADALESLVMAHDLPGEHCEVEQALAHARGVLDVGARCGLFLDPRVSALTEERDAYRASLEAATKRVEELEAELAHGILETTALEALEQARDKIATFGDRAWETGNMTMAQGIGESLEILTAMIAAERERLADAGETIDPYAMHICDTCDSESGMECTRRNCHLNNAWHPRHTEHAKPEPGDVVAWSNSRGEPMIGIFGGEITQGDAVVLMRAADVRAAIREGK